MLCVCVCKVRRCPGKLAKQRMSWTPANLIELISWKPAGWASPSRLWIRRANCVINRQKKPPSLAVAHTCEAAVQIVLLWGGLSCHLKDPSPRDLQSARGRMSSRIMQARAACWDLHEFCLGHGQGSGLRFLNNGLGEFRDRPYIFRRHWFHWHCSFPVPCAKNMPFGMLPKRNSVYITSTMDLRSASPSLLEQSGLWTPDSGQPNLPPRPLSPGWAWLAPGVLESW
jgi:hypothetical protein